MVESKSRSSSSGRSKSSKQNRCPEKVMVHIKTTSNNCIITATNMNGDKIYSSSGGVTQKNSRKSTTGAAKEAAEAVADYLKKHGASEIIIKMKGGHNSAAVKGLNVEGIKILIIKELTPVAHGGVKLRKQRRI